GTSSNTTQMSSLGSSNTSLIASATRFEISSFRSCERPPTRRMFTNGMAPLSTSLELRPALFHEGRAAFDVVLGGEALLHQRRRPGEIRLAIEPRQLLDGALRRMHGERRVLANALAVVVHIGVELGIRHDAVDQAHAECLLSAEQAAGKEDLLGIGRPDDVHQSLDAGRTVAQTKPGRRYAELAVVRGDADVAGQRHRDAAADAEAPDARDRGLGALAQPRVGDLADLVVVGHLLGRRARLLELRDVGARDEGLVPCPGDNYDADHRILLELVDDDRDRLPHVRRGRIALGRLVEDELADRAHLLGDHVRGRTDHRCLLDHAALLEARDSRGVVSRFLQHGLGVLALLGRGRAHLEGRAAHVDGLTDQLDRAKLGRVHWMRHLQVLDLRIGEHLVHLVDRAGRHARLVELLDQFGAPVGADPLFDLGVEQIAIGAPRLVTRELLVGHQLRRIDALAEALVDVAARGRDVDVAGLGLEHAGRDRGRMVVASLAGHIFGDGPARGLKVAHPDHRLQERARHPLALPRRLALEQRDQDADGAMQARAYVGHGDAGTHRSLPFHAGDPHKPAHALGDLVEARAFGVGAVLAEARDRAQDDARVHLLQAFVVDAQPELHVGAVVLDHDVGLLDQLLEDGEAVGFLEIERDRLLVAMQVLEVWSVARPAHVHVAGAGRHLDLDAVGAPIGEVAHRRRTGAYARQVEHGEAGKRSCGHDLTLVLGDYSTRTMAEGSISSQT